MNQKLKNYIATEGDLTHTVIRNLMEVSDLVQIKLQRMLRDYDLTLSQYSILKILHDAGKPLPCLEIASRTITVTPGITGLIDRLEKAGFVHRRRCEKDRRVVYIEISDSASKLISRLEPIANELYLIITKDVTEKSMETMNDTLEVFKNNMSDEPRSC